MSDESIREENSRDNFDHSNDTAGAESQSVSPASSPRQKAATGGTGTSDPFANLDKLRLPQDFAAQASVRPVFTTIAVRKPNKQEFVRVRPGSVWRFETGLFKDEESGDYYMVSPPLWSELSDEIKPASLALCVSRNSPVPFFWPLILPGPDGRWNRWHESAAEAAKKAENDWLKVVSDRAASCYVPHLAQGALPEPVWPDDLTLADLLKLAFRDRLIGDVDHPILRQLRGEA
jgi:hypothetical protein